LFYIAKKIFFSATFQSNCIGKEKDILRVPITDIYIPEQDGIPIMPLVSYPWQAKVAGQIGPSIRFHVSTE
jgi:hypothetical protein